jgi:hypothetical protein
MSRCKPNYDPCLDGKLNQIGSYAAAARSSAQNAAVSAEQSEDFSQASATSATNAATSATNAATSATEANNYLTQVTNIYDDFSEKYLGSFDAPPVTTQEGALYFDTVANSLYVWNGASWVALPTGFNEFTNFPLSYTTPIPASELRTGSEYQIVALGSPATNWVAIGAASATVGERFTKNATAATGNGTARVTRDLNTRFADVVNVKDFGAIGNGVDDTAAIQAAFNAGSKNIFFPPGEYLVGSTLTINASCNISGYGAKLKATSSFNVIFVTSSNVSISGIEIEGVGVTPEDNGRLIRGQGVDNGAGQPPTYIKNLVIRDCYLHDAGYAGIRVQFVDGFLVESCRIENVGYVGIAASSVKNADINGNTIKDIPQNLTYNNEYGIYFSRSNNNDLVRFPISENCVTRNNTVANIPWEGLDCHGGRNMYFCDNKIDNCGSRLAAISITYSDDQFNNYIDGPKNVICTGNVISNAGGFGIRLGGDTPVILDMAKNILIANNSLSNCGTDSIERLSGGISIFAGINVLVNGNTIESCTRTGVYIAGPHNDGVSVTNNVFRRIYSDQTVVAAIRVSRGGDSLGKELYISGNQLMLGSGGDTFDGSYGVQVSSTDTGLVKISNNDFVRATAQPHVVTSVQVRGYSSAIVQTARVSFPITTSVSFVEQTVTLPETFSENTTYNVIATIASSSATNYNKNGVLATRVTPNTFTLRVFTVDGTNFSENTNVPVSWVAVGY